MDATLLITKHYDLVSEFFIENGYSQETLDYAFDIEGVQSGNPYQSLLLERDGRRGVQLIYGGPFSLLAIGGIFYH